MFQTIRYKQGYIHISYYNNVAIVGERCRHKTKARLRSILTYGASTIPNYGIMGRLLWDGKRWKYIAGQCYTSEIKTVRECILKG